MSLGQATDATPNPNPNPQHSCVGDGCPPACPSNPPTGAILALGPSCGGGGGVCGKGDDDDDDDDGCGCGGGGGDGVTTTTAAAAAATTASTKETDQQGTKGEGFECVFVILVFLIIFDTRQKAENVLYQKDTKVLRNSWTLRILMTGLT